MHRRTAHRTPFVLIGLVASLLLVSATTVVAAPRSSIPFRPVLTGAIVHAPGSIAVLGTAFTPGGEVDLVIADVWSGQVDQTHRTTATLTTYGRDGSQDPAAGFVAGGMITEPIDHLCGTTPIVRAFDAASETWSNWLEVATTEFTVAVFGPNGSADPALGYSPGCRAGG